MSAPRSPIAATVRFTLGGLPLFDGVVDGRCLSVSWIRPEPGIPGLVDEIPRSRVTVAHVDDCACGDRSSALVVNIPTAHLDIDVSNTQPGSTGRAASSEEDSRP